MITFATKSVNTFYVMNTPAKGLEAHNNFVAERIIENDHDKASNVQITGKGCRSKDANQKQCNFTSIQNRFRPDLIEAINLTSLDPLLLIVIWYYFSGQTMFCIHEIFL